MSLVIDASVFVAACLRSDPKHSPSLNFLHALHNISERVYYPGLILPECAGAIIRGTEDEVLARSVVSMIIGFRGSQIVELSISLCELAAQAAIRCRLRGADACYVATAQNFQATLIAWDLEMLTRGAAVVSTQTPTEWLEQRVMQNP